LATTTFFGVVCDSPLVAAEKRKQKNIAAFFEKAAVKDRKGNDVSLVCLFSFFFQNK
jgi:hypothetical protein